MNALRVFEKNGCILEKTRGIVHLIYAAAVAGYEKKSSIVAVQSAQPSTTTLVCIKP